MISRKKFLLLIVIFFGILLLVLFGLWQKGMLGGERALFRKIQNRPDLVEIFNKVKKSEAEIAKNPEKVSAYFDIGLYWKSIAELGGGEPFFQKSLEAYEEGIEKFGQKNILFYLNGGKLAERLEDYPKAEKYYKKAIEISSADESGYLYLVDLYSYKLNRPKEEILKIFEAGRQKMVNPLPLIAARASYLRRIGDYQAALEDYKVLSQNYPNNQGYKEVIQELEEKIK